MPERTAKQHEGPTVPEGGGAAPFRIDSLERLAWCGLKYDGRRRAVAALDAQYRAMRRQLDRRLEDFETFFLPQAEAYVREQIAGTGERSVRTLGGLFGFRLVPGHIRITDLASAAEWATKHMPDAFAKDGTGKLDLVRIRAHMAETGEVVPGCFFSPPTETFYHKPPKVGRFADHAQDAAADDERR